MDGLVNDAMLDLRWGFLTWGHFALSSNSGWCMYCIVSRKPCVEWYQFIVWTERGNDSYQVLLNLFLTIRHFSTLYTPVMLLMFKVWNFYQPQITAFIPNENSNSGFCSRLPLACKQLEINGICMWDIHWVHFLGTCYWSECTDLRRRQGVYMQAHGVYSVNSGNKS